MARVQPQFEKFHEVIRTDYDMNATLREKRDIILERVRKHLWDNERPGFERLLQGSYKMKTGVIPIGDLEFDIDVGLRFNTSSLDYDAPTVRSWVLDAVGGHTDKVEELTSCVRVSYAGGEYHVDLVSYAFSAPGVEREPLKLASKSRGWRDASPDALLDRIDDARQAFEDTEDTVTKTDQFRRIVRCLRRWDDVAVPRPSKAKPSGLCFVLLVVRHVPTPFRFANGEPDDRRALEALATAIAKTAGRIVVSKPTPEFEDLLGRLDEDDMRKLKERFAKLAAVLREADAEADPIKACVKLRAQFGEDFPIPDPEESIKRTVGPAIVPSSSAA